MVKSGNLMLEREAIEKVRKLLSKKLRPSDTSINLKINITGPVTSLALVSPRNSGKHSNPALREAALFLRAAHYRTDKGTWFSALVIIDSNGNLITEDYNYDKEPDWSGIVIDSEAYAIDLEEFPRAAENRPNWLNQKLA